MTMRVLITLCLTATLVSSQEVTRRVSAPPADYVAPPASIGEFLRGARLIVVGRVEVLTQRVFDLNTPTIEHQVRVAQVLKGPTEVTSGVVIKVYQRGGLIVLGDTEVSADVSEETPIEIGRPYVLFLVPGNLSASDGYFPSFGPAGVFRIGGDLVEVPVYARRVAEFEKQRQIPLATFLTLIRSHRDLQ